MLETIKKLLGITDSLQDDKLKVIINLTQERLCFLLGEEDIPEELGYIVKEVAVARFNRIGSEGFASHSVEGESITWSDDDFNAFREDIDEWRSRQTDAKKGRVRFI